MNDEKLPENNEELHEDNLETEKENNEELHEDNLEAEKTEHEEDLSFEDIFANLRKKYNLNSSQEEEDHNTSPEPKKQDDTPLIEDEELTEFFEKKSKEISMLDSSWDDEENEKPPEKETENQSFEDVSSDDNSIMFSKKPEETPADTYPWDEAFKINFESKKNSETQSVIDSFEDISSGANDDTDSEIEVSEGDVSDDTPMQSVSSQSDFSDTSENSFFEQTEENNSNKISSEDTPFISDLLQEDEASFDTEDGEEIMHFDMEDVDDSKKKKKKKKKKHHFFPHKGDSVGEIFRKIVLIISLIAIIGSGSWLLWDYVIQPIINNRLNSQLTDLLIDSSTGKTVDDLENLSEEDKEKTFASLKSINKDFVGWLNVDGANINLPVVQTTDNKKYLTTTFKGSFLASGTLFIDYRNNVPLLDRNTIIYGHHMYDGSMFGKLMNFKNVDTFKSNPVIKFHSIYGTYTYKIYSVFLTNSQPEDNNGYVFNYVFRNLTTENSFLNYIKEISNRSLYTTGVDMQVGDQLLTLSTCDRSIHNGRFVVVARLLREGESEDIDTSKVSVNKSPLYPQVWYDKNKKKNPYTNAEKWFPQ